MCVPAQQMTNLRLREDLPGSQVTRLEAVEPVCIPCWLCQPLSLQPLTSQPLAQSFSEEDNRAKEEEMLNDPLVILYQTSGTEPPCCTATWEWDFPLHILWLAQSQLGNYVLNKWGNPLWVTQSQMRSWDANPGLLPAHAGLFQTWLPPNLSCFLQMLTEVKSTGWGLAYLHSNSSFTSHHFEPRFLHQGTELITYLMGPLREFDEITHIPSCDNQHLIDNK